MIDWIWISFLCLCVGSFLNVFIIRLPIMHKTAWRKECIAFLDKVPEEKTDPTINLLFPRSRCLFCWNPLRLRENIPLLSYCFLRGRCSHCGVKIHYRYPLVEGVTMILSILIVWHFGMNIQAACACILTWALIALSGIDIEEQYLPDSLTLGLLWLGLSINGLSILVPPTAAIAGAILGYSSLWAIYWAYMWWRKKEGLGYGDFKLLAALGAWMGWQAIPSIVLIASFSAMIWGSIAIGCRRMEKSDPMPFGPFLALGGWVHLWRML